MALIDYKCEACGNTFFEIVKKDSEKVICPKCSSSQLRRIYKGKFYSKGGESCSGKSCSGCSGCGQ